MGYYSEKLSAERLKRCYEIASPRVRQYLEAEIQHILNKIRPGDVVLELGCGYGRIIPSIAGKAATIVGIDTSFSSLLIGREILRDISNCHLLAMDAALLAIKDDSFDIVVCIQNGISAFQIDRRGLIRESIRVTKPGGTALFSSYSDDFWPHRLEWFQAQSDEGLLGEIDYEQTRQGVIVCRDGFKATTFRAENFLELTSVFPVDIKIVEVDGSSLFCEILVK